MLPGMWIAVVRERGMLCVVVRSTMGVGLSESSRRGRNMLTR